MYELCPPMPDSFPLRSFDTCVRIVADASHVSGWWGWSKALSAVAFRYRGLDEAHQRFTIAMTATDRFVQEDALYSVFVNGVSTIDCAAFAAYHLGAIIADGHLPPEDRQNFPINDDALQSVNVKKTAKLFSQRFSTAGLSNALAACRDDARWTKLREYRDVLTHRCAFARNLYVDLSSGSTRSPSE